MSGEVPIQRPDQMDQALLDSAAGVREEGQQASLDALKKIYKAEEDAKAQGSQVDYSEGHLNDVLDRIQN